MLVEKINTDLRTAMLAKDELKTGTLRMLVAELKNEQIKLLHELSDEETVTVLARYAKQRKDSIQSYEAGNRPDLADKEKKELELVQSYLPEQMTEAEVEKFVKVKMTELNISSKQEMGKLMGAVMGELKGKTDGGMVKKVVEAQLTINN